MRTTVDLSDNLLRAAKARAADRGERLRDVFERALAQELGDPAAGRGDARGGRVVLPLVGSGRRPEVEVTNDDIEAALAQDDAMRYGGR